MGRHSGWQVEPPPANLANVNVNQSVTWTEAGGDRGRQGQETLRLAAAMVRGDVQVSPGPLGGRF
jgi:hypothetical protein